MQPAHSYGTVSYTHLFVEQIVHTIDGMVWSMNEQLPLAAFGSGGPVSYTHLSDRLPVIALVSRYLTN